LVDVVCCTEDWRAAWLLEVFCAADWRPVCAEDRDCACAPADSLRDPPPKLPLLAAPLFE